MKWKSYCVTLKAESYLATTTLQTCKCSEQVNSANFVTWSVAMLRVPTRPRKGNCVSAAAVCVLLLCVCTGKEGWQPGRGGVGDPALHINIFTNNNLNPNRWFSYLRYSSASPVQCLVLNSSIREGNYKFNFQFLVFVRSTIKFSCFFYLQIYL